MTARAVSSAQLISELGARLRTEETGALAFDADGTLWSGDVGDDVFRFAVAHGRLREEARAELERQAEARDFEASADVNETAKTLFDAYLAGRYPERDICELMTWCYAGYTLREMALLAEEALHAGELSKRMHEELRPIIEFARGRGLRTVVISASPRTIVEQAAGLWGFGVADIAASTPRIADGVISGSMDGSVPYAASKCVAGRALLGDARWIASFGDNVFDLEMLREAEIGVAVRPKPALQARLAEVPGVLRLLVETREIRV